MQKRLLIIEDDSSLNQMLALHFEDQGFEVTGVLDCAANSFFLIALETGTVTWVAVVVSLYPVATVLLARIVLKERITSIQLVGVALALAALVFVSWGVNNA